MKNTKIKKQMFRNQGLGMWGWNSEMQVVFAYPLPPIPTHFQLILIENQPNPPRIRVIARSKLTTKVSMKGHLILLVIGGIGGALVGVQLRDAPVALVDLILLLSGQLCDHLIDEGFDLGESRVPSKECKEFRGPFMETFVVNLDLAVTRILVGFC
jgi:hypothetical protein